MKQFNSLPTHVAIIMDGNRRWAKNRHLPLLSGHRFAADNVVENLVDKAGKLGIKFITFWAWSTENWQRQQKEVTGIMRLFDYVLNSKINKLHKKGARLKIIGDITRFPLNIRKSIEKGIEKTKNNKKITIIFALNYGGRDEILRAIKKLDASALNNITRLPAGRAIQQFNNYLDTSGIPDPDIIIRTGGEKRLSGFLLWQSEYAELYFTDVLFPDFNSQKLEEAINWYESRERRFGK